MSESLNIQQHIKNNADELQKYFADMKTWEQEIKEREMKLKNSRHQEPNLPLPRNAVNKSYNPVPSTSKMSDEPQPSTSGYENLKKLDEALFEKELGNKYVKEEKWKDAIKCYTNAIHLDPNNAIYYANRGVCYNKLGNWKLAEVDSTVAIQLDENYLKAYKRRALARKMLKHYESAREDYVKILTLEPGCQEARKEIIELDKKIQEKSQAKPSTFNYKNIFAGKVSKTVEPPQKIVIVDDPPIAVAANDSSEGVPLTAIVKPIHLRSKEPLRRVPIKQVESRGAALEFLEQQIKSAKIPVKPVEIVLPQPEIKKTEIKNLEVKEDVVNAPDPKSYIQFVTLWRRFSDSPKLRCNLLKRLYPNFPTVFESSLESDILSEMISTIASDEIRKDADLLTNLLKSLANVGRFKSLVCFLSADDEKHLKSCFDSLAKTQSDELRSIYEC